MVDRYSIVSQATGGAAGLAATLREVFGSFGIPDTITTDGGPEFTAHSTAEFLDSWGVQHRICSAYTPHSNNRAETGVKSMKRLIAGNTGVSCHRIGWWSFHACSDTITTDGGPEFTAHSTAEFLDSWGVQHRICSAYTPHSNNRAETGVKSMNFVQLYQTFFF